MGPLLISSLSDVRVGVRIEAFIKRTAKARETHLCTQMTRHKQTARKSAGTKVPYTGPKSGKSKSNGPEMGGIKEKKKRRWRPGTVAKREIRKYQKGKQATELLIKKRPFGRIARKVAADYKTDTRFQLKALVALQEAAESYVTSMLLHANYQSKHAGRSTVQAEDVNMARAARGEIPFTRAATAKDFVPADEPAGEKKETTSASLA